MKKSSNPHQRNSLLHFTCCFVVSSWCFPGFRTKVVPYSVVWAFITFVVKASQGPRPPHGPRKGNPGTRSQHHTESLIFFAKKNVARWKVIQKVYKRWGWWGHTFAKTSLEKPSASEVSMRVESFSAVVFNASSLAASSCNLHFQLKARKKKTVEKDIRTGGFFGPKKPICHILLEISLYSKNIWPHFGSERWTLFEAKLWMTFQCARRW